MVVDLHSLGAQIDASCDAANGAELTRLIELCETELKNAANRKRVVLYYYMANAYSGLSKINTNFEWNAIEEIQEILALRRAIAEPSFEKTPPILQLQIQTNLANRLLSLGRLVEAIEQFSKVISTCANFAKALGNRAYAKTVYSSYLYDENHQCLMLDSALSDYNASLSPDAFWDTGFEQHSADVFAAKALNIRTYLDGVKFDRSLDFSKFSLGKTSEENEYRRWCLSNKLFLNPLNDFMEQPIVAHDVFHLPSHSYSLDEDIRFPDLYNVLKQEYVSARYHLFVSLSNDETHFADRDVLLFESFDYGQLDFKTEQLKIAFRVTYSIFDKIALFLNDYFHVGLKANQVSFRKIWEHKVKGNKMELRANFIGNDNLPLRGLYFLSKDFFDKEFVELASPDAQGFSDLRNFVEHRFLTLVEIPRTQLENELHRYVPRADFECKTIRLMKMARAALIYLSMAMKREEEIRENKNPDHNKSLSFPIYSAIRQSHDY